ncbi:hypothetical protein B0J12DRAFT_649437, partial [Macrophomina phaseolina]
CRAAETSGRRRARARAPALALLLLLLLLTGAAAARCSARWSSAVLAGSGRRALSCRVHRDAAPEGRSTRAANCEA